MRTKLVNALVVGLIMAPVVFVSAASSRPFTPKTTRLPELKVETQNIDILKNEFKPSSLKIARGTIVAWTNRDTRPHMLKAVGSLPDFDTQSAIKPGESYSFSFNFEGEFYFEEPADHFSGHITILR